VRDRPLAGGVPDVALRAPAAGVESLGDLAKTQDDIETLRKFWDSGFRDRLQSDDPKQSALKIWDGFHLKLESVEGGTISFGKSFRYWISFK
jgi:hypothetical protein